MSLEQALQENTATMKYLIAVLSTVAEDGGSTLATGDTAGAAGEATTGKRNRRTKAQIEADNAAAAGAGQATTSHPTVQTNNTGVVQYVIIEKHNTAAAIQAGEVVPSMDGIRVVTKEEYEAYKAKLAGVTTASATVPTFQELTTRLVAIHGKGGNEAVMQVLGAFGAANVPALAQADQSALAAKIHEVEVKVGLAQPAAATGANLFG